MVHHQRCLLQVEMNTISVAFPALSSKVAQMHKELVTLDVLDNRSLELVCEGFAAALKLYSPTCRHALMIVRPVEVNPIDQDLLIEELQRSYGIILHKKSLREVQQTAEIFCDGSLRIDGIEYGVVYYRSAYTLSDYPSDVEWNGRRILEQSKAIKCPDVGSQLVGMKKTQQVLCEPGILEKFLPDCEVQLLRRYFTGLYALDDPVTQPSIVQMALSAPDDYVLKPQREGGGNNFYGHEMVSQLKTLSSKELSAFVLMDLIKPVPFQSTLVRNGMCHECDAVAELGIYGVYVGDLSDNSVTLNNPAGYLLRTKAAGVLEGGVASGFSVLDSLELH
jgi:glutathione synthase